MSSRTEELVEDALVAAASDVLGLGPRAWRFTLSNGTVTPLRARIADGWLELQTTEELSHPEIDDVHWLRLNATCDGGARAVRPIGSSGVSLRADVALGQDAGLQEAVVLACADLHLALLAATGDGESSRVRCGAEWDADEQAGVSRLIAEAGWPMTSSPDARIQVPLGARAGAFDAHVRPLVSGRALCVVELLDLTAVSLASQRAIAALLMALPGAVRSIAGLVIAGEGETTAAIASVVSAASVEAIDQALSALAAACQLVGREVHALGDEPLAAAYLALIGSRDLAHNPQTPASQEEDACLQQLSLISVLK